jgi:hypothetical protein
MNKKEKNKNKRAMTQLKAYFLIVNVVLAIVAFGWLVSGEGADTVDEIMAGNPTTRVEGADTVNQITDKQSPTVTPIATPAGSVNPVLEIFTTTTLPNGPALYNDQIGTMTLQTDKTYTFTQIGADGKITTTSGLTEAQISNSQVLTKVSLPESSVKIGEKTFTEVYQKAGTKEFVGKDSTGVQTPLNEADLKKAGIDITTGKATTVTDITTIGGQAIISNALQVGMMFGLGYLIGGFIGGNADVVLGSALAAGTAVYQLGSGDWGSAYKFANAGWIGLGVGAALFLYFYKDTSTKIIEFNCLPYQPPIGGEDCEKCNDFEQCSEYVCKSLGQACQLLNAGTGQESCDWVNPHDVNSPKIRISNVLKGYKWIPDTAVRPPATGAVISQTNGNCVKAFTPLEFTIETDEPAQCKIDYNLTKGFDEMSYYIGGSNLFSYNHTEKMSLPSPSAINAIAPELKNDGTYTLYARCRDANGNFNQDAYSVRFCVEKGPDTTPPKIEGLSIPSNSPISYNTTSLYLEVYVNEPAECKWSREDRNFEQMETDMSCSTNLWEINNNNVYTCKTILTGIKDKQDNEYYFRCKDQPNAPESERNPNVQSSLYNIIGTQPLNILDIQPSNETIKGSTDTIAVSLEVKTDNGYKNGEAFCYYTETQTTDTTIVNKTCTGEEGTFIQFAETGNINKHTQRQDLVTGDYTYYIKCVDLGGNAAYDCTRFSVEVDRSPPIIVRAYKESEQLKIITSEKADCSYSHKDCNFDIKDGIKMSTFDNEAHNAEWLITKNYYIRCNDKYNNQPNPNTCSVVIRPYKFVDKSNVVVL